MQIVVSTHTAGHHYIILVDIKLPHNQLWNLIL